MCEFSPVSRAARFGNTDGMTAWRLDYNRMKTMLKYYKIPRVTHITVDGVYARRKGPKRESREIRSSLLLLLI